MALIYNGAVVEPARETPIRARCDVAVVGGGTAGFVAALAAARAGAQTILIEQHGSLGGAMINGATALHSFFNLYKAFPGVERTQLVRGIPQEIVERMVAAGGCPGHVEMAEGYDYDSVATCFDHEIFKLVSLEMLVEAGVRLLLHTATVDAVMDGAALHGVIVETKSGREAILAKVCVDCSGDGDVAYHAGVPFRLDVDQPQSHSVSMTFGLGNVDLPRTVDYLREHGLLSQLVRGDKGSAHDDVIRIGFNLRKNPEFEREMEAMGTWGPLSVSLHEGELTYVNTTRVRGVNTADVEEITRAEIALRRQATEMAGFLKRSVPGFERSYINWTSIQVGVRRTRTIECEYDISSEDVEHARRFDDEIALYGFHDLAPRRMIAGGGAYGIPYRALLPKGVENLLVAGKMITSDWTAHMSTRNTVACMAQGQAAGAAAALCVRQQVTPRALDVTLLRQELAAAGVYLGVPALARR